MEPVRVPRYIINIDTSGIWLKLKNPPMNYCRVIHHFSTFIQYISYTVSTVFQTQLIITICLVIESRKPSDQLASNIYINVMPISIALFKFLSCNDIVLLVVHFFREENRSLESSKILVDNSSLRLFWIWIVTLAFICWRPYYPVLRKNVG